MNLFKYGEALTASPTLEDKIRSEQLRDAEIKKIVEHIKRSEERRVGKECRL